MNEADIPIDIHTLKLQDWLISRRIVPKNIQSALRDIRSKISNALQDMPSNDDLIKLLKGSNINYFHCKEIVEILKQTEKDTKTIFGRYGSQRMKDWLEILRLYEKDNVYLAETAQLYVRNVNYEIPNVRKQISKLDQQCEESLKRAQDLNKPEAQLLAEHAALLSQLGVKGNNLREEFLQAVAGLPDLYATSIKSIGSLEEAVNLYVNTTGQTKQQCLPIIRHLIEFGNTTVYQFIHKEAPLSVQEPLIKINISEEYSINAFQGNEIDFGDDNGGTSSTISGEMIDFSDFNADNGDSIDYGDGVSGDIDWGIENNSSEVVEINFDIPVEEYGIVVEGAGTDSGIAKEDHAYTLLDSPIYRERFADELYELEAFLRMRLYELRQVQTVSSNIMFSLMETMSTYDEQTLCKMLNHAENILKEINCEHTRHLFQLKHSPKYADLLASKLKQMLKAVEKIVTTKEVLKMRAAELKKQRMTLLPVLDELVAQTNNLQGQIERDISKRYKNRVVNLLGGVSS